jgi:hypothetical protein
MMGLTGALVGLLWRVAADPACWLQELFVLVFLGVCVLALQDWRHAARGILRWDGQSWSWDGTHGPASGALRLHLDLQFCLILSLHPGGGKPIWLCPQRRSNAHQWRALRRAVFSRAGVTGSHHTAAASNSRAINANGQNQASS